MRAAMLNPRPASRMLPVLLALAMSLAYTKEPAPEIRTIADSGAAAQLIHQQTLATVILFTDTECPISNKYAPEVQRLVKKFHHVRFWLAYPDPGTTASAIAEHLKAYAYPCGALRDPDHHLVRRCGARVTPEAAVFLGETLVYRGRIDDRFPALGVKRPEPGSRDLEAVLDQIARGEKPTFRTAPAVGCSIAPR